MKCMSPTCARVLAGVVAAPLVLVGMAGCAFQPGELLPPGTPSVDGGEPPDSRPVVDGSPLVDGSSLVDSSPAPDTMIPIDGSPPPIDARPSPRRRKRITVLESQVEAPGPSGSLADFPVLFSVTDTQIRDRASADGSDIYFTAADGETRLEHEIERWVSGTGELVAWVKIPTLSETEDTVFYVNYGDAEQAGPGNPVRNVWTASFAAVWHLAQDPGPGGAGDILDSTTGNDGTAHVSMQTSNLVAGQIGNGIDFDGSDDEISFTNPISGGSSHTISAWVNQRTTNSDDAVVVLGTGEMNRARWLYSARRPDDVVAFGFYTNDEISNVNIENDGWTLLHWTYDGTSSRLYINGQSVGGPANAGAGINTQGNAGRIGNVTSTNFGSAMNLDGRADEVRIATVARPAEWVRTEFNNQSTPASFYTVGTEEP